jgi:hypothetical protein
VTLALLKTPSSFPNDPGGWIRNQIGHAYLIGALGYLIGLPVLFIVAAYAIWEWVQWRRYQAEAWDCFDDLGHVCFGVAIALIGLELAALHAIFLASGYLRRAG